MDYTDYIHVDDMVSAAEFDAVRSFIRTASIYSLCQWWHDVVGYDPIKDGWQDSDMMQLCLEYVDTVAAECYIAVSVDGKPYEYNADSICYQRDDGDFEFWFYHGLAQPNDEVVTKLIRTANEAQ